MSFAILGMGTALPATAIPQTEAVGIARRIGCRTAEQAELLPNLYRQTAIERRHLIFDRAIVDDVLHGTCATGSVFLPRDTEDDRGPTTEQRMEYYVRCAGPLARRAADQALAQSGLTPAAITHVITVSCTGFSAPGVDFELIRGLGLAPTVARTHIGFMGCHGALNGLRVARAFTGADSTARVLLCAVELCSLHYHYGYDPKKMVANALFADGAAALVGAPTGVAAADAWRAIASGSCLFSDSAYAMTWNIGNHGFEMTLSTRVPDLIHRGLRPWLDNWLAEHGVRVAEVASWAIHPGGPRVLSAVEKCLNLLPNTVAVARETFAACGNMSSPTVLFILERLRSRAAPRPCVALGFGPGLVVEAALFT
jgi:predicted naringenin-chalcone synthase